MTIHDRDSSHIPLPVNHSIDLMIGTHFRVESRHVLLERVFDSGKVDLRDLNSDGLLEVRDPEGGANIAPTIDWMREMYALGLLHEIGPERGADERQSLILNLDPEACAVRDKKFRFRRSMAERAVASGVTRTDSAIGRWLEANYGKEPGDGGQSKPCPSTLRRWMRAYEHGDRRPGYLVSKVGRLRGQSQLDPFVDNLVHEAALWWWSTPRASKMQAYAWLHSQIAAANRARETGTPELKCPSKETVRKRIEKLRCRETAQAKYGAKAAAKLYEGSGEALTVDRPLEVVFMDATTLEQTIVFDEGWKLPACKVRMTVMVDACTSVILGHVVYAGPNRSETSLQAIINCMWPTDYPADVLEEHPDLRHAFGAPAAVLPDNEKALVGVSTLPSLNNAGITVLEPPVEHPQAKAMAERCFRTIKGLLALLPGTIVDPKHAKDLDYDGVKAAVLTLPQLRELVARVVASLNVSESKGLDDQAPIQVWMRKQASRATPVFADRERIARCLSRNFEVLLTRDGVELDRIRYRDREKVSRLISNAHHTAPRRQQRRDGSATVSVSCRRQDGNIDQIEILDTLSNEWVALPSTQPEYTHNLSAWEHDVFTRSAKRRRESFKTQADKLKSVAMTMRAIDELCPGLKFQQRREMAALYQSRVVNKLAGRSRPTAFPSESITVPRIIGDELRRDSHVLDPIPAAKTPSSDRTKRPPTRDPSFYGHSAVAATDEFDWDAVELERQQPSTDTETGAEPLQPHGEDEGDDGWAEDQG